MVDRTAGGRYPPSASVQGTRGGAGLGGGPGAFVRPRPSEPPRGQRAGRACGAAPLGRRGSEELAFVNSELAVCSLRGCRGRVSVAVTADPSGRAVLPLLSGQGKGSRCARCCSWDACLGPGLNSAESIVVSLEQKKPDRPNKKPVKETPDTFGILKGLGTCIEVASTDSRVVVRDYFHKAHLNTWAEKSVYSD